MKPTDWIPFATRPPADGQDVLVRVDFTWPNRAHDYRVMSWTKEEQHACLTHWQPWAEPGESAPDTVAVPRELLATLFVAATPELNAKQYTQTKALLAEEAR